MAHRSGLYELHRALGATFQEERGWDLPERFEDPLQEHRAIRESAGVLDLSFRTVYRVTGTERARFLNGMLTNDIGSLREGHGCYACVLTAQGKIVADLHVYAFHDYHLVELDSRWKERALDYLNKYIIADDVAFEELEDSALVTLQGPDATVVLRRALPGAALPDGEFGCVEATFSDSLYRVIRASLTGEEGYKLAIPAASAANAWQSLQQAGAIPVGMAALNTLRLEAGIPWFGTDFDEGNFPQEAGIEERAVSFTKGCYVGQEFVVRIAHRGHVNRRASGLTVLGEQPVPRPGNRIFHGDTDVGHITSAAFSPTLGKIIGLGMIRREAYDPGTAVRIEGNGKTVPAEVTPLPFYRRGIVST